MPRIRENCSILYEIPCETTKSNYGNSILKLLLKQKLNQSEYQPTGKKLSINDGRRIFIELFDNFI